MYGVMNPNTGTILCVEADPQGKRCTALMSAGYWVISTTPTEALEILAERVFDVVVAVGLSDSELVQIHDVAERAEIIALNDRISPQLALFLVDEHLRQLRHTAHEPHSA